MGFGKEMMQTSLNHRVFYTPKEFHCTITEYLFRLEHNQILLIHPLDFSRIPKFSLALSKTSNHTFSAPLLKKIRSHSVWFLPRDHHASIHGHAEVRGIAVGVSFFVLPVLPRDVTRLLDAGAIAPTVAPPRSRWAARQWPAASSHSWHFCSCSASLRSGPTGTATWCTGSRVCPLRWFAGDKECPLV